MQQMPGRDAYLDGLLGGLKKLRLPCRRFRPGGRDYLPTDFWRDAASSILSQRCRIGGESTFTAGGKN